MSDYAVFIGWGQVVTGRERQAQKVFQEAVGYWMSKQQEGVESIEPFLLTPHGGDLAGFLLVRGDRGKLAQLMASDEVRDLNLRSATVVNNFGMILATTGQTAASVVTSFDQTVGDLIG